MHTNNLDMSSSGVNLSLSASLDSDLAQIDFDESFKGYHRSNTQGYSLVQPRYFNVDRWLYIGGELPLGDAKQCASYDFDLSESEAYDLKKMTKQKMRDWLFGDEGGYSTVDDLNCDLKDDGHPTISKIKKDDLHEFIKDNFILLELIEFYRAVAEPLYDVVCIRGHCQGDYAEVILPHKTKAQFNPDCDFDEMFTNYFYNQPAYVRLTIDEGGEDEFEIILDEFLPDTYKYGKDVIIQQFRENAHKYVPEKWHKLLCYICNWTEENLPDNLT